MFQLGRVVVATALVFIVAGILRAEEPRAIVDKAIKAVGGEENLAKLKSQSWTSTGTYFGGGAEIPFTAVYVVQWPDKFRVEIKDFMTIVQNGDKAWRKMGDDAAALEGDDLAEAKEGRYAGYVTTLLPLKEKVYTLTAIPDAKVGDGIAAGVKVSGKGHRDVSLYFDKGTGRLVKGVWTVKAQEEGGKEVTQETLYSNYKDIEGAKIPMKVTIVREGKKYVEAENSDLKAIKPDAKLFEKP